MGKFIVTACGNGEYQFNLKASNGQIVLTGAICKTKIDCLTAIKSVQKNVAVKSRFAVREDGGGRWYFELRSSGGRVLGTSQLYSSERSLRLGIETVVFNAGDSQVFDG